MPSIQWEEKYSVNIEVLDEHHNRIFAILAKLFDELGKQRSKEVLRATLLDLKQYAVDHFAAEEIFMKQYGYPGYAKHKKEHETFREKVEAFQLDFEAGRTTVSVDLINFMTAWLDHHIQQIDKAYAPFLNDKGIC